MHRGPLDARANYQGATLKIAELRQTVGLLIFAAVSSVAHAQVPEDFAGVWSTNSLDTLNNPAWDIVGKLSCRCTAETYEYLDSILYDPANDHMSASEIVDALERHTDEVIAERLTETGRAVGEAFDLADDPAIQCERFGVLRTILHSDPIEFEVYDDRIEIIGEDLTIDRTVYMDGRGHPDDLEPTLAGHSIGWIDGDTLVIETVGISANLADDQLAIHNSDQVRAVERFRITGDGNSLDADVTLHDPVMLQEPLTIRRPRVRTVDVELDRSPCEVISGQF